LAAEQVGEIRWWDLDELEATTEHFAPKALPRLVRDLAAAGPPAQPIDAGV
jgi:hypothetical protein